MTKYFSILLLFLSSFAQAQKIEKYVIELDNPVSVQNNLNALAQAEADFWNTQFGFDSSMRARIRDNSFSIYMQYVEIMKHYNYKMEKVLLTEQYNFKSRRERFMQTFLNEQDFKKFQVIIEQHASEALKKYNDQPSKEIEMLRKQVAGWNVLGHAIEFK